MRPLPIDEILDQVVASLRRTPNLVLEAPPGAGKTARVPAAMLDADLLEAPEILVLQPRRLAARMAARFVASQRGEKVGGTVGYQVRFEVEASARTRLRFISEALLLRRLLADPQLERVGAVVFDEFHERHLATDVGLAMMHRLQQRWRPNLRILVMSATLDAGPVADYLGATRLRCEGRRYPVEIDFAERPDQRPLERRVASAVAALARSRDTGDMLVFLPGAREIRSAAEACEPVAREQDLELLALHGELPPEAQDRAVRPAERRKVVLSTNVAETSVTIDGVTAVVDSGLARMAGHDPWSGLPTLRTRAISRASAAQRAGRAGRTRPGRCIRLYTAHDHDTRPQHEVPEIRRLDLADSVLLLAALGLKDPLQLAWLDPPPDTAIDAARNLLCRIGAVDASGGITDDGRRMASLPLHPRLARVVLEAQRRGRLQDGATFAALLGERDLRRHRETASEIGASDLLVLAETLGGIERARFDRDRLRASGLSVGRARHAVRIRDQIVRAARRTGVPEARADDSESALLVAVLAGFPDRVARRREARGRRRGDAELLLALGGSALLDDSSVVRDDEWLVAVEVEQREHASCRPLVRLASAIDPAWLLDLFADRIAETVELLFNPRQERVEQVSRMTYESLVLDESRETDVPVERAAPILREAALAAGPEAFVEPEALAALVARVALLCDAVPETGILELGEEAVRATLSDLCEGRRSFADLRDASLLDALQGRLGEHACRLDELAPATITLAGGRRLRIRYALGKPPWAESFLQDFFGLSCGPAVAQGRVPVTLHLLAPNRRAVQVTTDLSGFWQTHYPVLRRSLSRRYPRHDWPDDPTTAKPPPLSGRRQRR